MIETEKKALVKGLQGLGLVVIILLVMGLLPGKGLHVIILLMLIIIWTTTTISDIRQKKRPSIKQLIKSSLQVIVYVTIFYYLMQWLGGYGWWGILLGVLVISGWRLWKNRVEYLGAVKNIETRIWGKPLDEYRRGELKKTKVKIKW